MHKPFIFLILFFLTGCAPYKMCTRELPSNLSCASEERCCEEIEALRRRARRHWIYRIVPRHRCQIHWYDVGHWIPWALFGNDDDGIFGEEPTSCFDTHRPIGLPRALEWGIRNPLHNFFFYVIGSAHRTNGELTILKISRKGVQAFCYSPVAKTVFAEEYGNSLYLALHGGKPFLSFQLFYGKQLNAYIGWRERGNFGMKFIPARSISKP